MTKQEKYNELRTRIVAHCPHLLDLEVGTELYDKDKDLKTYVGRVRYDGTVEVINWSSWETRNEMENDYEILGTPPTLQDVLVAIRISQEPESAISGHHYINQYGYIFHDGDSEAFAYYDLTKSLEDQSEETLEFLLEIIK